MFLYGVLSALTTEESQCITTDYKNHFSDEDIDYINNNYDAFILPLADAFRKDFENQLQIYTSLLKKLKIPCVVIGVGLRAPYEPSITEPRDFDNTVVEFVKEVLNHSSCLGLRGQITGDYLKRLGFREDIDYRVIGCPSLYTNRDSIRLKPVESINRIGCNLNGLVQDKGINYFKNFLNSEFNVDIIQQRYIEFLDLYYGVAVDLTSRTPEFENKNIFSSFDFEEFKRLNKVHYYWNVPAWIHSLNDYDLFVGSRFHGIAAAILAGVPSYIMPFDSRTRELSAFHNIPCISGQREFDSESFIQSVVETDWNTFGKRHKRNYYNYIDFLSINGLNYSRVDYDYTERDKCYKPYINFHNLFKDNPSLEKYDRSYASLNCIGKIIRRGEYLTIKAYMRTVKLFNYALKIAGY